MAISSPEQPLDTKSTPPSAQFSVKMPIPSDFIHGTFKGEPAITIPREIEASLAQQFDKTLIGKFSQGKPGMDMIRKFLSIQNFAGTVSAGLLDKKHILIRFELAEDYIRLFSKPIWIVNGKPMRILKWIPDFRINREPSIVPIWISLPGLPIHLVNQSFIFSLVSSFSKPLRIDKATENLLRPSVARVQVEFDLLELLPSRVWVQSELGSGFWQSIEIDDYLPLYCKFCWHIGHEEHFCTVKYPEMKKSYTHTQNSYTHTEFRPKTKGNSKDTFVPRNAETSTIDHELDHEAIIENTGSKMVPLANIAHSPQHELALDAMNEPSSGLPACPNPVNQIDTTIEMSADVVKTGEVHVTEKDQAQKDTTICDEKELETEGRGLNSSTNDTHKLDVAAREAMPRASSSTNPIGIAIDSPVAALVENQVIEYSKGCPISNSFEILSMPSTKEKSSGIDSQASIHDELKYMSLDPKVELGEYISDKVFEEKFTPARKTTRIRKRTQIFDL